MPELLSAAWFARFSAELSRAGSASGEPPLALGQVVTGTPHGTIDYTILLDDEGAELIVGSTARAVVTLVEDWETAQRIVAGTPLAELLAAGRITLRGNANALLAAQTRVAALGEALRALRGTTQTDDDGQTER